MWKQQDKRARSVGRERKPARMVMNVVERKRILTVNIPSRSELHHEYYIAL